MSKESFIITKTRSQFIEELGKKNKRNDPVKFICPKCGGQVKQDQTIAYMTNPPKYRYYCDNCNYCEIL